MRIVHRDRPPRWARLAGLGVWVLALGGPLVRWRVTGEPGLGPFVVPVVLAVLLAVRRVALRREVVVDEFGVDLPRRRQRIGWATVDHVRRPGPFDDVVVLVLDDGTPRRTNLPAHLARRVSQIGRAPLAD